MTGSQGLQGDTGPQGLLGINAMELRNIVTVSPSSGDFTDPVEAVNSIADASLENPYLVYIGPGKYTLTNTLVMKEYVSIMGAGQGVTILSGNIGSSGSGVNAASALVSGADNANLRNLTIENQNQGLNSYYNRVAIYTSNNSSLNIIIFDYHLFTAMLIV